VGNESDAGVATGQLAEALSAVGKLEESDASFAEAIAIHGRTGYTLYEGIHLCAYARLKLKRGQEQPARELFARGIEVLQALGESGELEASRIAMRAACAEAGIPALA
jgi:hypothetical protein